MDSNFSNFLITEAVSMCRECMIICWNVKVVKFASQLFEFAEAFFQFVNSEVLLFLRTWSRLHLALWLNYRSKFHSIHFPLFQSLQQAFQDCFDCCTESNLLVLIFLRFLVLLFRRLIFQVGVCNHLLRIICSIFYTENHMHLLKNWHEDRRILLTFDREAGFANLPKR